MVWKEETKEEIQPTKPAPDSFAAAMQQTASPHAAPGQSNPWSPVYQSDPWGLMRLDLVQECADFYLLLDLSLDGLDGGKFQPKLDFLALQFAAYTDMVVGGELRHARGGRVHVSEIPKPMKDALQNVVPGDRHEAWRMWHFLRQRYGTIALKWAIQTFYAFRVSSVGGPKWANIAKVIWLYERGEMTPLAFVDACWGLQHNGGCYFNKPVKTEKGMGWRYAGLQIVLDAGRKYGEDPATDEIHRSTLLNLASPKVSKLWRKKRKGLNLPKQEKQL